MSTDEAIVEEPSLDELAAAAMSGQPAECRSVVARLGGGRILIVLRLQEEGPPAALLVDAGRARFVSKAIAALLGPEDEA